MTREEIIEKIRKVEALFRSTDLPGEMQAAKGALDRLREQLATAPQPVIEWQFRLHDPWKRQLFLALARRHGYEPYRKYRQHRTTVMLRATDAFVNQILWPEFTQLSTLLHDYLNEVTHDIITRSVHRDLSDARETPELPPDSAG